MAHQPVYNIFKAVVAKNILEHNMDLLNFGKRVQQARKSKELTQEVLAEKTGLSVAHISGIENGRSAISLDRLLDLVDVLDVSPNWLLQDYFEKTEKTFAEDCAMIVQGCSALQIRAIRNAVRALANTFKEES